MKNTLLFVALATSSMFFYSCSKQDLSNPAVTRQSVTSQDDQDAVGHTMPAPTNAVSNYTDDELLGTSPLAGEQLVSEVSPGLYRIIKFIDTGDDETSQFKGYKFRFKANGDLIATTNTGKVFTGKWNLNSQGTMMELQIGGTPALKDLDDDDWRVKVLTDQRIRLNAPDPDVVVFVKI